MVTLPVAFGERVGIAGSQICSRPYPDFADIHRRPILVCFVMSILKLLTVLTLLAHVWHV